MKGVLGGGVDGRYVLVGWLVGGGWKLPASKKKSRSVRGCCQLGGVSMNIIHGGADTTRAQVRGSVTYKWGLVNENRLRYTVAEPEHPTI